LGAKGQVSGVGLQVLGVRSRVPGFRCWGSLPSPLGLSMSYIFGWTLGVVGTDGKNPSPRSARRHLAHGETVGKRRYQGVRQRGPGVQQKMWDTLSPWGEGAGVFTSRGGPGEGSVPAEEISRPTCHSDPTVAGEESRPGPWRKESERDSSLRSPEKHPHVSFPRKRESSSSRVWTPAFAGVTTMVNFIPSGGPKAHDNSLENRLVSVIPAQAGIQLLPHRRGSLLPRG
jgi:hypothetical protein